MKLENNSPAVKEKPSRAGRREWFGLAVIALPCMLYSMDLTVLNLALPQLSAELKPSSSELLWIVDIYGFMVAGFLIIMGNLGDRIGRRKLLLIGACAFGIASVVAAYAKSAEMLIIARAILGIAGATLAPSTLSLIRNMFLDAGQRTTAIGIWVTSYSVGAAIGPLIGGVVLQNFWWGAVFLIAVPVMILLLILAPILLPEYRNSKASKIDLLSALLSLLAVLPIIFGLKKIAENGVNVLSLASIGVGILMGIIFIQRQQKLADPLIDLKLFRSPGFSASLLIYTFGTFVAFSSFIFLFQYMQLVKGLTPVKTGLWSIPFFVAFIIGSMVAPVLIRKIRPVKLMGFGLLIAALGFGMLTRLNTDTAIIFLVTATFIYCLGLAPVFTLTTDLIVGSAQPERAGTASAISETGSEFGGALGIAIVGSIGTLIYRTQMEMSMPEGTPNNIASAAKDTLGAAVAEADLLSPELGLALLTTAKNAFISGMKIAALICAILSLLMAITCLVRLQRVFRSSEMAG